MATIASSDPRTPESADAPRGMRAFFALSPDAEVRESLAALGRDVARRCRGRAVSPENAHLTLAFIGDIDKSALPVLQRVGDGVPKSGFDVNFDSLGAWRASGVAWIAPSVLPPALQKLHAALAKALAEAGFTLETRPFRPHVTLARRCLQPLPRARSAPIVWHADKLHLVGSELRRGRARLPRPRVLGPGGALGPRRGCAPRTRPRARPAASDRRTIRSTSPDTAACRAIRRLPSRECCGRRKRPSRNCARPSRATRRRAAP